MRQIKYRAWDKKFRKMFNPTSIDFENEVILVWREPFPNEKGSWCKAGFELGNECELMQFTGLKDKNSKEIYEGDIVEERWANPLAGGENVDIYKIGFAENGTYKMYHSSGEERFHRTLFLRYSHVEVIGNIYENQQLVTS